MDTGDDKIKAFEDGVRIIQLALPQDIGLNTFKDVKVSAIFWY